MAGPNCHSPLPVWVAIADEWGSVEAMGAACGSPNGISTTNLKTLNPNPKKNCDWKYENVRLTYAKFK